MTAQQANLSDKARSYVFELMRMLAAKRGTDLYIMAGSPPVLRVGADLIRIGETKLSPSQTQLLAGSLMDQRLRDDFVESSEANFAISVPEVARFRVNAFVQRGSVSMVLRQITSEIPTIEELKLPLNFKDIVMSRRGLVMLVGATGQGKSTTMASMIRHRSKLVAGHIITIEDPVEYIHQHDLSLISQREVGSDTESFKVALKNSLRQAPDVILIGEVRDRETMERALEISETGHLCLCTLHANNTNQAMERVTNFFPAEQRTKLLYELSLNIRAVASQRLLRTADDGQGRVPAVELLINTPLISQLIARGDLTGIKEVIGKSRELGMQTFDQSLYDLVQGGQVSAEEALRNADSPNDLRLKLRLDNASEELMEQEDGIQLAPEMRGESFNLHTAVAPPRSGD